MFVNYISKDASISKTINDNYASVLISDSNGSFFSQGLEKNSTFYQGFLCRFFESDEWTMFKFIESIEVIDEEYKPKKNSTMDINIEQKEIANEYFSIKFVGKQTLALTPKHKIKIKILLDPRKIYDFSNFGRNIKIYEENDVIIAEYENNGYKLFLGISGFDDFKFSENWIERNYEFDAERSKSGKWFVFDGITLNIEHEIKISQALTKEELIELLKSNSENNDTEANEINELSNNFNFENDDEKVAFLCSRKAMNDLIVDELGIYAGYYWFFQYWTRDESISLGGLIIDKNQKNETVVKNVIKRLFSQILEDGRLPNRFPHAALGSADGIGWAVKRFSQYIELFDTNEKEEILKKIEISCERLIGNYSEGCFIMNKPKETWMDTNGSTTDVREGARIEIQALQLNMYKLLKENIKDSKYQELEDKLRNKVKDMFFKNQILCDGVKKENENWIPDKTQRPNIFLAYYIYPELLSEEEWINAFDNALDKLWLDWGGLSTIDKNHEWFKEHYTGENDDSYHRGDSWYFVNNIAAIAMHKLNKNKYKEKIDSIKNASIKDILEKGILGGASEVSSAKEQRPEGTWQQAWSVSTFIELIYELKN